jgi:carbonic anhydrase
MSSKVSYRATSKRQGFDTEAVVVHCSDHRFQEGFREFLSEGLGLRSYALLAIPGGAHFGSMAELQPKFAKVGLQSAKFLINRSGARRIIVIGHDDCLFFKDQLQFFFTEEELNRKQISSLKKAGVVLREWLPRATTELYFADSDSAGNLQFLSIE